MLYVKLRWETNGNLYFSVARWAGKPHVECGGATDKLSLPLRATEPTKLTAAQ